MDDSFLSGLNATIISELHARWSKDPSSVDSNWAEWFKEFGKLSDDTEEVPSWGRSRSKVIGAEDPENSIKAVAKGIAGNRSLMAGDVRSATLDSIRAIMIIRAYRIRGHLLADLDPLNLQNLEIHPELDPATYGFSEKDYDRPIFINNVLGKDTATLSEIMDALKKTYCGTIGVEFMHIQDPDQKAWIQERIEKIENRTEFSTNGKIAIYNNLLAAENFENYLHKKYIGTKRFGLDGGESLVPALLQILKRGGQIGLKEVVLGMAHRGRLNVLHNVLNKPFKAIISEFLGNPANPEGAGGSGDVKYHMGSSADITFDDNKIHLSLAPNPSHLEIVDPVVIGRVRAKQSQRESKDIKEVLGVILHGDAAFAGQGVVAETFAFSALRGYRTGGTIHIIINNQIGFTTGPAYSRSSPYPTDVAKMVMAPIFHVNGDDAEAVVHAARVAMEFRQTFGMDVVLDIICYRRYGHNEGDEPSFTQPLMYKQIEKQPTTRQKYLKQLLNEKILNNEQAKKMHDEHYDYLEKEFEAGRAYKPNDADWLKGQWTGLKAAYGEERRGDTAVNIDELRNIGKILTTVPENINIHKKLIRILKNREESINLGKNIDWATAEGLAFGSVLKDGFVVRLSGQDSSRGTFSQRHAVFIDQYNENRYIPLANLEKNQVKFEIIDSPLSEASVMGFEYGFAQAEPNALVMWEAQFGDFANGAQVVIDQFISAGESKWLRMNGLVLLLPHGYEGQGPEHSSARLERYLQLCAEDNMQVVNCTTPANYFHVLRRQVNRDFRKPLIIMTPKSLLRHKNCISNIEDFGPGTSFHRVLNENNSKVIDSKVTRIILCSGKIFYDLNEEREKLKKFEIKIIRIEQLYPFPVKNLKKLFIQTPNAEVIWCQEEPMNMGAWSFVRDHIEESMISSKMKKKRPIYIGRSPSASPATGTAKRHLMEQKNIIEDALKALIKHENAAAE